MVRLFVVLFALCLIKDAFPAPVKKDRCSDAMDIAFILDASTDSVTFETWKKMLHTAKKFVNEFGASEDGNHYAVMTFGTNSKIHVKFNKYNGTDLSSEKINGDIDGLRRTTGRHTYIDRALRKAERELFTVEAGMRKNARKVAFVVTDGIQTKDRGHFEDLRIASSGLKAKDVEIFAIGVGDDIDVLELLDIASSEDNVFSGRNVYREFEEYKKALCSNSLIEMY